MFGGIAKCRKRAVLVRSGMMEDVDSQDPASECSCLSFVSNFPSEITVFVCTTGGVAIRSVRMFCLSEASKREVIETKCEHKSRW